MADLGGEVPGSDTFRLSADEAYLYFSMSRNDSDIWVVTLAQQ
jgi:hypothetical protein